MEARTQLAIVGADPQAETYLVGDKRYYVHPIARMFPLLNGLALSAMIHDMRDHGLRRPILVTGPNEDVVVDGRNRLRVALELDIDVRFEVVAPDASVADVIWSENLGAAGSCDFATRGYRGTHSAGCARGPDAERDERQGKCLRGPTAEGRARRASSAGTS